VPKAVSAALPDKIAESLKILIVRGSISPGEHLGQTELAARFGMSKVPIREALKLLAAEGLLRHDRNRGYFVAHLRLEEAMQFYKLRRWLESELLATARWPTETEIRDFQKRFDQLDELERLKKRAAWTDLLGKLRYDILDLSPQKLLLREATRLWTLTDRYRALLPREVGASFERFLIDAMAMRDRNALLAAYHKDRDRIETTLQQAFEGQEADYAIGGNHWRDEPAEDAVSPA
jgi:DNA-binding GntR family transcriptional regulator